MLGYIGFRSVLYRWTRSAPRDERQRCPAYHVASVLLGLLLLTAAVPKTHQAATEPVLGAALLESRWFVTAVFESELLLSFWLFSGLLGLAAWWVTVVTFAAFAVVTAGKVFAGDVSCRCFGRLPSSPWLALSIDISAIVALLFACRSLTRYELARSGADVRRAHGTSNDGQIFSGRGSLMRVSSVLG